VLRLLPVLLVLWSGLLPSLADAAPRRSRYVTIPVDIGIGPSAHLITGPVFRDQPIHSGLSLSIQAIIDKQTIRRYRKQIPARYRKLVQQMDEVRYSPFIWLPETVFISPALPRRRPDGSKRGGTGMYGATWRPFSIGIPWVRDPFRFTTSAGARLTYAFLHSDTAGGGIDSPTHFLRIGIDLRAQLYVPFSDEVGISAGWTSQFYPPQPVGGSIFAFGPFDESIWHIGQGTLKLHVRVPYRTQL
jgi:hypothetical protein